MYFYIVSSDEWKNIINPGYYVGIYIAFLCSLWHDGPVFISNVHYSSTCGCEFVYLIVNVTSTIEQISKYFDLFLRFDIFCIIRGLYFHIFNMIYKPWQGTYQKVGFVSVNLEFLAVVIDFKNLKGATAYVPSTDVPPTHVPPTYVPSTYVPYVVKILTCPIFYKFHHMFHLYMSLLHNDKPDNFAYIFKTIKIFHSQPNQSLSCQLNSTIQLKCTQFYSTKSQ